MLGDPDEEFASTMGIAISGSDIHVIGYEAKGDSVLAKYWKNGNLIKLPTDMPKTMLTSIGILGSDVYIGGYIWVNNDPQNAFYWKNGVRISASQNFGEITKIIVSGSNVFFTGIASDNATYWLNEEPIRVEGLHSTLDIASIKDDLFLVALGLPLSSQSIYLVTKKGEIVPPFDGTDPNMKTLGILVKEK